MILFFLIRAIRTRGVKLTISLLLQNIMKDKWMNMGYEDDELKPYLEPEPDYRDHKRIGESASMYITLTTYRFLRLMHPL